MLSPQSPLLDPEFLKKLERLSAAPRRPSPGQGTNGQRQRSPNLPVRMPERQGPAASRAKRTPGPQEGLESLFSRIFSREDVTVHLLLDASLTMSFGAPTAKFQYARKLAAALGYASLLRFGRVGVGAFAQSRGRRSTILRSRTAAQDLFVYLQRMRTGGMKDFSPVVRKRLARIPGSDICVILSDFLDRNWERSARALLDARCDVALVQILAPEEIQPSFLGNLRLVDSKTHQTRELEIGDHWMDRYQEALDTFCGAVADLAQRYDMLYVRAGTETSFETALLKTLRAYGSPHGRDDDLP